MIEFKKVSPKLDQLVFSRSAKLNYACLNAGAERLSSLRAVKTVLSRQSGDSMIICPPGILPAEVINLFEGAQEQARPKMERVGKPYEFLTDLCRCLGIGLASHLAIQDGGETFSPGACGVRLGEGTPEQARLSGPLKSLKGRFIFTAPWQTRPPLGRYSLALALAKELGALELDRQAVEQEMDGAKITPAMVRFFWNVYAYNFAMFLAVHAALDDNGRPPMRKIATEVAGLYHSANQAYELMGEPERELIYTTGSSAGWKPGEIFLARLAGQDV